MAAITCACGAVRLEAEGAPMFSAICHCTSCRTAGQGFDAVSDQDPVVDESGGTAVVLWRKDRVRCVAGCEHLESHRLTAETPTRRLVASCCKSPVLLDFTRGFWIGVYRDRVAHAPPPSVRMMTGSLPRGMALPNDGLPRARGPSARFMLKLLTTWMATGFRTPRVAGLRDG